MSSDLLSGVPLSLLTIQLVISPPVLFFATDLDNCKEFFTGVISSNSILPISPRSIFPSSSSLIKNTSTYPSIIKRALTLELNLKNSSVNTKYALLSRPNLTCVDAPAQDIGAASMRLLTKIMKNEEVDQTKVVLPYAIIKRGTN